jgi:hypothetical protein
MARGPSNAWLRVTSCARCHVHVHAAQVVRANGVGVVAAGVPLVLGGEDAQVGLVSGALGSSCASSGRRLLRALWQRLLVLKAQRPLGAGQGQQRLEPGGVALGEIKLDGVSVAADVAQHLDLAPPGGV